MTIRQRRDMDLHPVEPRRLKPARQSNIWERRKRCEIAKPVYCMNPHPRTLPFLDFKESFGSLTPSASIGQWHRNLSAHGDLLQVAILVFSVQGETYKRLRF
jgi:hypothetical protein